jgi:uncharacterized protein (DUF58 family)
MNPIFGWLLAAVALVVGWTSYGWRGLVFALTVVLFWMLIQFNRSVKVLRAAAESPVGHVDSAVMLNAKLKAGLPMTQVVALTTSLGKRIAEDPETWSWADQSGAEVRIVFVKGRCASWLLQRPAD